MDDIVFVVIVGNNEVPDADDWKVRNVVGVHYTLKTATVAADGALSGSDSDFAEVYRCRVGTTDVQRVAVLPR